MGNPQRDGRFLQGSLYKPQWIPQFYTNQNRLQFRPTTINKRTQQPLALSSLLLLVIRFPNTPLDRRPLRNAINPLQQVGKGLDFLLRKATPLPAFDPRPSLYTKAHNGQHLLDGRS
jgi:hypothetical protein